jgi:WD40 repeat protein
MENIICNVCKTEKHTIFKSPCGHLFCKVCFINLISSNKATINRSISKCEAIHLNCTICNEPLHDVDTFSKSLRQLNGTSETNNFMTDLRNSYKNFLGTFTHILEDLKNIIEKLITRSYDKWKLIDDYLMFTSDLVNLAGLSGMDFKSHVNETITKSLDALNRIRVELCGFDKSISECVFNLKPGKGNNKEGHTSETVLTGHKNSIYAIALLKSNKLASASFDRTIKIWDLNNCENLQTLTGHSDSVECLLTLRDGRLLSGSADSTICVWDGYTGEFKQTMTLKQGPSAGITYFSLYELRSGNIASSSSNIHIWDLRNGQCILTLRNLFNSTVFAVIELTNGQLASSSSDKSIMLWDMERHNCLKILNGHTSWVHPLLQLKDSRLASGSGDKTIRIWDTSSFNCVSVLKGHTEAVFSLIQLRDGGLLSGSEDTSIRLWDIERSICLKVMNVHKLTVFSMIEMDDDRIVSSSGDYTIKIWNY